ncbi:uncharacterized protein LOC126455861 [Schistocerca serialis cubense]|uniref:uncharacterized protein LOC126455861 n=1 Tax=Schistocerca serialis cubense TaxID=2023355 RepID=UPI00214F1C11|nr:uncharacterized protein LOC126455861 [Schistocerca serialis cubense]
MGVCCTSEASSFRIISPELYAAWTVIGLAPTEGEAASETSSANTQCCQERKPVLRSAIWFLIIALITAVVSYFQEDWNVREWELATVAYMFQKWIGRAGMLLTYGTCATAGLQHLQSFMRALRFADKCLGKNERVNWKKTLGNIVVVTYYVVTSSILLVAQKDYRETYSGLSLVVVVFFKTMVTMQFVFLVLELWERFQSVNARIRELLPPLSVPELRAVLGHELGDVSPQADSGRLRQLREAYLVLMHAAETLQQHFGLPLALIIAGCVGGTTFFAYDVVSSGGKRHSPFEWSIMSGLWMVHHSLQLVAVSLACAATVDSAAYTGPLLLRASALCDWRGPELDAFMQLTLRGPRLQFSAAGLVVIDRRLLVSALAVVVTYLVILRQQ